MKKILITSLLVLGVIFSCNLNVSAKEITYQNKLTTTNLLSQANSGAFRELPAKANVSLDKMWTVKFTSDVTTDKIDGIVVQKNSQFIPVTITISDKDKITIKPVTSYAPNSTYSLKIFLSNGKKCSMNFTTEDSSRNADTGDNTSYQSASPVSLGDVITGKLTKSENEQDWYKLQVGKDCNLNLTLQQNEGKATNLYIYGENGNNDYPINKYNYSDKSAINLEQGLAAGTYYIKVESYYSGSYKLRFDYNFNNDNNDTENNDIYLNANNINANGSVTGHIGYAYGNTGVDKVDFYKVNVKKDGRLNINLEHKEGKPINVGLYGKDGDNDYAIDSYTYSNKSVIHLSDGLAEGTYYIKVMSEYKGGYSLSTTFEENNEKTDGEGNNTYLHAIDMNVDETKSGHIGYTYNYNNRNENDWYKIVLNSDSEININLSSNEGMPINATLYGKDGDNEYPINNYSYNDKSTIKLSNKLKVGTYYIKVNSRNPQGYKLNVTN